MSNEIVTKSRSKKLNALLNEKFNTDLLLNPLKEKSDILSKEIKKTFKELNTVYINGKHESIDFTYNIIIKGGNEEPDLKKILEKYPFLRADKEIYTQKAETITLSHIKQKVL